MKKIFLGIVVLFFCMSLFASYNVSVSFGSSKMSEAVKGPFTKNNKIGVGLRAEIDKALTKGLYATGEVGCEVPVKLTEKEDYVAHYLTLATYATYKEPFEYGMIKTSIGTIMPINVSKCNVGFGVAFKYGVDIDINDVWGITIEGRNSFVRIEKKNFFCDGFGVGARITL